MDCDHCNCIVEDHPCCHCGVWLKDIPPVETTERLVTCNPIAMEYERRYGFVFMGLRWYAVRHTDESVEMARETRTSPPGWSEVDCRLTQGWLSPDLECGIDVEPQCYYHRHRYGPERPAEGREG